MVTSSTAGEEQMAESVEELRERLEAMKRMMARDQEEEENGRKNRNPKCKVSIIDASFLSFVFIVVLVLIIGVSIHSFQNLYYAVLKKFAHTREHTEL